MSMSILIVRDPGHCDLLGNEVDDHQAKLGAAETQPYDALEPATLRALIHRSCHPSPIQHERLNEVYTFLPDEQIEAPFSKTELSSLPLWPKPCSSTLAAFGGNL